jgi:hypothetical protein
MLKQTFLAVAAVAISAGVADAQFTYPVSGGQQVCTAAGCRPVQTAVTAAHNAVVNTAEAVRGVWTDPTVSPWHVQSPAVITQRMAAPVVGGHVTFTPGQPVRNVLRVVKGVVAGVVAK